MYALLASTGSDYTSKILKSYSKHRKRKRICNFLTGGQDGDLVKLDLKPVEDRCHTRGPDREILFFGFDLIMQTKFYISSQVKHHKRKTNWGFTSYQRRDGGGDLTELELKHVEDRWSSQPNKREIRIFGFDRIWSRKQDAQQIYLSKTSKKDRNWGSSNIFFVLPPV